VLNERHLRRVLKEFFAYYHESRTHLGWNRYAIPQGDGEKDTPDGIFGRNNGIFGKHG